MTQTALISAVVADQRDALIRDELRVGAQRERLERAIVQAIRDCGATVDEMSDASGLTPAEIRGLLETPPVAMDLASLAGMR